jgi:F-type H+-transporting ATPase subunit epsilon
MFELSIITVNEVLFHGEAISLTAPGSEGELTVLAHHMQLITPLKAGELRFMTTEGEKKISITDGILEVGNNKATVLL